MQRYYELHVPDNIDYTISAGVHIFYLFAGHWHLFRIHKCKLFLPIASFIHNFVLSKLRSVNSCRRLDAKCTFVIHMCIFKCPNEILFKITGVTCIFCTLYKYVEQRNNVLLSYLEKLHLKIDRRTNFYSTSFQCNN